MYFFRQFLFIFFFTLISLAHAKSDKPLRYASSAECGECHQQIYSQWKLSLHATSTALDDPIHAAFYKSVMGDPSKEGLRKKGKYPVYLQCQQFCHQTS